MQNLVNMAIKEAKRSKYLFRHGAVVVNKGRLTARGFNQLKTNPKLYRKYGYFSIHAECASLLRASSGDTLIVVRIRKNGNLTMSKPCEKCVKFAKDFGIKRIIYSDWDSTMTEIKI